MPVFSPRAAFPRLLCALALSALVTGCGNESPSVIASNTSAPATRAAFPPDDLGRVVNLKKPAERVLVIGPGALETIFMLGGWAKIAGRDSAADYPPEMIKKVPIVADYKGPSFEAALAQRPDFVIAQGETWDAERIDAWQKKLGVPVAALTPTTVEAVQKDADKIAKWLGLQRRSLNIAPATKEASVANSPSVFIEISRSPLWTSGRGSLVSDVVTRGGWKNVAEDVEGYKAFSKEALLARQPDFYIATGKPEQKARIVADLRRDEALGKLTCVREGKVIVLLADHLLRPGPRLSYGIRRLQRIRLSQPALLFLKSR